MRTVFFASTIAVLGLCSTAEAHFNLMAPAEVVAGEPNGKGNPPCGPDTGAAATPTPVQGGHPLNLMIRETVPHDGFYRVALAMKSRSEFPVDNVVYDASGKVLPPTGVPQGTSARADSENPAVFPILADNLFLHVGSGAMTFPSAAVPGTVMVPNVNCDRCIIQVIEFMHPHGFNPSTPGPGGGYFYHHCAEVKITADPALPLFTPPGADGGAPDATTVKDAASETSGAAGSGSGGAGGGTTGAAGVGAGGTGAAGAPVTGIAGSGGAAGTGAAGSSGTGGSGAAGNGTAAGTAGSSGSTGAAGSRSNGGGCNVSSNNSDRTPLATLGMIFLGLIAARRGRQRRNRSNRSPKD
jgi:hypothetical protein